MRFTRPVRPVKYRTKVKVDATKVLQIRNVVFFENPVLFTTDFRFFLQRKQRPVVGYFLNSFIINQWPLQFSPVCV